MGRLLRNLATLSRRERAEILAFRRAYQAVQDSDSLQGEALRLPLDAPFVTRGELAALALLRGRKLTRSAAFFDALHARHADDATPPEQAEPARAKTLRQIAVEMVEACAVVTARQFEAAGISRQYLAALHQRGIIRRIRHGVYGRLTDTDPARSRPGQRGTIAETSPRKRLDHDSDSQ